MNDRNPQGSSHSPRRAALPWDHDLKSRRRRRIAGWVAAIFLVILLVMIGISHFAGR